MAKSNLFPLAAAAGLAWLVFGDSAAAEDNSQASGTVADYVNKYLPYAKKTEQLYGVPALVTLAQAGLESAWGKSRLAREANNHFAIKAGSTWSGPTITLPEGKFRKYSTVQDSFNDHGKFLTTNQRYGAAFNTNDPYSFMLAIAAAGYAEDPAYGAKLTHIMNNLAPLV